MEDSVTVLIVVIIAIISFFAGINMVKKVESKACQERQIKCLELNLGKETCDKIFEDKNNSLNN